MSTVVLDGFHTTLSLKALASANYISISRSAAMALNATGVGNRVYLMVSDRVNNELVIYDHVGDWDSTDPAVVQLPVTRNARGLGSKSFAYGACVDSQVNSLYIQDYLTENCNCGSGSSGGA